MLRKKRTMLLLAIFMLTSNAQAVLSPYSHMRKVLKTVGAVGLACAASDYLLESLRLGRGFIQATRTGLNTDGSLFLKDGIGYICIAVILGLGAHTLYKSSRPARGNFWR